MKNLLKNGIFAMLLVGCMVVGAEEKPALKYVDAVNFRMINKAFEDTENPYTRLPNYLKDSVRKDLWSRGQCSSGLGIRFATNSTRVGIKYTMRWNTHMFHMADTGLKGTDLYILTDNGKWDYVNTNRPIAKEDKQCEKIFVENLDGKMNEYLVYLPLYDGVMEMFISVDSLANIQNPQIDNPRKSKKIVMYGTSVLQGGCATRTGMAATNMMQRDLNCEVVNLGFSGEGKMDMCMARAMAQIEDADIYILDPVPNCTEMMCDTLTYDFVKILCTARPNIPIVMVESAIYTYAKYDHFFGTYLPKKNAAYRKNYEKLKKDGYKNLYYITSDGLYGYDNEGTVDGIHFTDIGFRHYADKMIKVVKPLLKKAK